jgi:hypothetical protein
MGQVGLFEGTIVLLVVLFGVSYFVSKSSEVVVVKSAIDGRRYLVRNLPDKQEAADLMGYVTSNLIKLVNHMRKKYKGDVDVQRLQRNFNPDNIFEASEFDIYTSYSVNKGEKIVLCMRSRDGERKLVQRNTMMFVAIHELAHLMNAEVGHGESFWEKNKLLLREATSIGLYTPEDYAKNPQQYCGIKLSANL